MQSSVIPRAEDVSPSDSVSRHAPQPWQAEILVHKGLTTLDVLVIGLVRFESVLTGLGSPLKLCRQIGVKLQDSFLLGFQAPRGGADCAKETPKVGAVFSSRHQKIVVRDNDLACAS